MSPEDILLTGLILLAATLYSSVGHAGASGYLAAMALLGVSVTVMKPTALALNVLVALVATTQYYRAGAFSWRLFWPLAMTAIPMAYLGGTLTLPSHIYKPVLGVVLIYAAWRSFHSAHSYGKLNDTPPRIAYLFLMGATLGFLSGLTGVGGGIFLSPLLLLFRWAQIKVISGVAAAFILVNSIAGLLGTLTTSSTLPEALPYWAMAALLGGFIGSEYGSKRLGNPSIHKLLALVLLIAGLKMVATA